MNSNLTNTFEKLKALYIDNQEYTVIHDSINSTYQLYKIDLFIKTVSDLYINCTDCDGYIFMTYNNDVLGHVYYKNDNHSLMIKPVYNLLSEHVKITLVEAYRDFIRL